MHTIYSVSYDLRSKNNPDYRPLHAEFMRSEDWYHALKSTWYVFTEESEDELCNRLKRHLYRDDDLIISEITTKRQGWMKSEFWRWLGKKEESMQENYDYV